MVSAVIVAAGVGRRMGLRLPKQFLPLKGKAILERTIKKFQQIEEIKEIIVVSHPNWIQESQRQAAVFDKVKKIVAGGARRQDSVWAGLQEVSQKIVLVHDAVRPLVSIRLIMDIIKEAQKHKAAIPALPVKETVKWVEDGWVKRSIDRRFIWLAQTPQGFQTAILKRAYQQFLSQEFTDDASLVEQMGIKVKVVLGDPFNIKITTKEDLEWAEKLLALG